MVLVREWTAADLPSLAALRMELAAGEGVRVAVTGEELAPLLSQDGAGALVAELDGAVAGMLTYFVYPSLMRSASWAQIAEVVVTASARRRGAGRALLEAAMERFRELGVREASVATRPDNQAAAALYRSAGFAAELRVLERPIVTKEQS